MRSAYPGYLTPTQEEFKTLWNACLFVFDTSVLLNFYEYSPETTENLKKIMTALKDRLWMPHHVGWEFVRRRRTVIHKQNKPYEENMKKLKDVLDKIAAKDSHQVLSDPCLQKLKAAIDSVQNEFDQAKQKLEDSHVTFLEDLYKGRIGPAYMREEKAEIEKEGQKRYAAKIPPGYKDKEPEESPTDNPCGDYLIWCQMKIHAKSEAKPIIFITDETKEDTWWKLPNSKTIGPRPEMIEEFLSDTEQRFYMYSATSFLKHVGEYVNVPVDQSTIDEAKSLQLKKHGEALAKLSTVREDAAAKITELTKVCEDAAAKITELTKVREEALGRLAELF